MEYKVWVSSRAARLNLQDKVDFDGLAEASVVNGGFAQQFIYCAFVICDEIFIIAESESNYKSLEEDMRFANGKTGW